MNMKAKVQFLIGVLGATSVVAMALVSSGCNSKGPSADVSTQKPLPPEARKEMMRNGAAGAARGGTR